MPATAAQLEANRNNAKSSTGPRTAEGKARSSRNATKLGLFSMNDFVLPGEQPAYDELCESMWNDLAPKGALQEILATEVIRAAWRLIRCGRIEADLVDRALESGLDPMQDESAIRTQNAVDRARAQSNSTIRRNTTALRRFQTDREIARETMPDADTTDLGLASSKEVIEALNTVDRGRLLVRKVDKLDTFEALLAATDRQLAMPAPAFAKPTRAA